jgi:hypothetical protein
LRLGRRTERLAHSDGRVALRIEEGVSRNRVRKGRGTDKEKRTSIVRKARICKAVLPLIVAAS